jgi:excisionase family DNA binding protein
MGELSLRTIDQVAALLGCSRSSVQRRIRAGELRALRIGRLVRIRDCDLDDYIAGSATTGPAATQGAAR